jgi:16S rRNA (cytidine1402-2'-O)-methyltransferase
VIPLPGANAAIAALSASGFEGAFTFVGFLPPKPKARRDALAAYATHPAQLVLYEAPHRVEECVADLRDVLGGARRVLVARELTKRFEQLHMCALADAPAWLKADDNHLRGEFVLVVEGAKETATDDAGLAAQDALLAKLMAHLPLKTAVDLAVDLSGAPRNALYKRALALREEKREEN